jgi:hypothetical protein
LFFNTEAELSFAEALVLKFLQAEQKFSALRDFVTSLDRVSRMFAPHPLVNIKCDVQFLDSSDGCLPVGLARSGSLKTGSEAAANRKSRRPTRHLLLLLLLLPFVQSMYR